MGSQISLKLDPSLSDPMIDNTLTLDEQFQALVEAAHTMGMRVMIDIIPRTNATESDLIIDHPDWFYWINSSDLPFYKPPYVDEINDRTCFTNDQVYANGLSK